jgi:hypothetical protein
MRQSPKELPLNSRSHARRGGVSKSFTIVGGALGDVLGLAVGPEVGGVLGLCGRGADIVGPELGLVEGLV